MSSAQRRPVYVPKQKRQRHGGGGTGTGGGTAVGEGGIERRHGGGGDARHKQQQRQLQRAEIDRRVGAYFRHDDDVVVAAAAAAPLSSSDDADAPLSSRPPLLQRPEDYMDDQDHDEWGGPSRVRREYNGVDNAGRGSHTATAKGAAAEMENLFSTTSDRAELTYRHTSIGERLLRQLGWRGSRGSSTATTTSTTFTAYVPADEHPPTNNDDDSAPLLPHHLTPRRMRKIVRRHAAAPIPPLHRGPAGLGYAASLPSRAAPEFPVPRRPHGGTQYRVANLHLPRSAHGGNGAFPNPQQQQRHGSNDDNNTAPSATTAGYETTNLEDFVGHKSSAGFALREDDDDAYDDGDNDDQLPYRGYAAPPAGIYAHGLQLVSHPQDSHPQSLHSLPHSQQQQLIVYGEEAPPPPPPPSTKASRINREVYETVAYEHMDSDDDDDDGDAHAGSAHAIAHKLSVFGTVLSSYATAAVTTTTEKGSLSSAARTAAATAADGSPMAGFVVSGGISTLPTPLFRGPDVPRDWDPQPHVFGRWAAATPVRPPPPRRPPPAALRALADSAPERWQTAGRGDAPIVAPLPLPLDSRTRSPPPPPPNHHPIFAGVAASMKSRFVMSTSSDAAPATAATVPAVAAIAPALGLPRPAVDTKTLARVPSDGMPQQQPQQPQLVQPQLVPPLAVPDYTLTRTIVAFHREPLLCKRFNVTAPLKHSAAAAAHPLLSSAGRTREEAYFYDEIMAEAKSFAGSGDTTKASTTLTTGNSRDRFLVDLDGQSTLDGAGDTAVMARPPMAVFKAIFEPESDEQEESESSDEEAKATPASDNPVSSAPLLLAADPSPLSLLPVAVREPAVARVGVEPAAAAIAAAVSETVAPVYNDDDTTTTSNDGGNGGGGEDVDARKSSRDHTEHHHRRRRRRSDGRKRSRSPADHRERRREDRRDGKKSKAEKKARKERKRQRRHHHRDSV